MNESNRVALLPKILGWGIGGILVVAPFYAPLTVAVASQLQHFDLLRIWKEIALTGIGITVLYFLITHTRQVKLIIRERLFQLVIAYTLLHLGIAIYDVISGRVATPAVIYGLMINLRLVGFFMVVYLAFKMKQLNQNFAWWKFLLIPAVFVVVFGLLQMTILPKDVLSHIGYSQATIVPYQTVDNNPDFARVQSTLRGPNPLGAYLVVIISTLGALVIAGRRIQHRKLLLIFLAGCLVLLFGTYSRSAYLGTILALATLIAIQFKRPKWLTRSVLVGLVLVSFSTAILATVTLKDNYVVETVLLHSNSKSSSPESSNSQRRKAILGATQDIVEHPLGGGVGSAGPASLRNTKHPGKISENYFLQVGQETGWLGMALFSAITIIVGVRLYRLRKTVLGAALISSLLGLTLVNMLSHAWTDDTLAYIWWGLAGVAIGTASSTKSALSCFRTFVHWNQKASLFLDKHRASKWTLDGLEHYAHTFLPPYIRPKSTVCDVGGGKRPYISLGQKKVQKIRVVGIDIDHEELALAPKGAYDETYVSDIANFSFKKNFADTIICQAVLEHVADPNAAIGRMAKMLRKNGEAVLFVPCGNALFARINVWMPEIIKRKILFSLFPNTEHAQGFPAYYRQCTPKSIEALAKNHGLEVVALKAYYFSNYFTFFVPIHALWRFGQLVAYVFMREQASEAFSITLRKNA